MNNFYGIYEFCESTNEFANRIEELKKLKNYQSGDIVIYNVIRVNFEFLFGARTRYQRFAVENC